MLVVIVIEAMSGSAGTPLLIFAFLTLLAERGQGLSELLKSVEPDVAELILIDVALYEFRPVFDIEASSDIAVDPDGCRMSARAAIEEPVSDFSLIFKSQEV